MDTLPSHKHLILEGPIARGEVKHPANQQLGRAREKERGVGARGEERAVFSANK